MSMRTKQLFIVVVDNVVQKTMAMLIFFYKSIEHNLRNTSQDFHVLVCLIIVIARTSKS